MRRLAYFEKQRNLQGIGRRLFRKQKKKSSNPKLPLQASGIRSKLRNKGCSIKFKKVDFLLEAETDPARKTDVKTLRTKDCTWSTQVKFY